MRRGATWIAALMSGVIGVAAAAMDAKTRERRVVPAYRELLKGGDAARRVMTSYDSICGSNNGPFALLSPDTQPARAASIARRLDAAGVTSRLERALSRVSAVLPGPPVTVCAYAAGHAGALPRLGGIGGLSLGQGRIKLYLQPGQIGSSRLEYTLGHEYHHEVARALGVAHGTGPLDTIISEGKADVFATSLYPRARAGHTDRLPLGELRTAWHDLMTFESEPGTFDEAFLIGRSPRGPRWPGYRLGFELVDTYARSARVSAPELLATPASVIVAHFRTTLRFAAIDSDRH